MSFTLPILPYSYDDLEPHISKNIMELHHTRHHQTYVDKLNTALTPFPDLINMPIIELLQSVDQQDQAVRTAINNHGGGHYNHSHFWESMIPGGSEIKSEPLKEAINASYGSYEDFIQKFSDAATSLFGSGWVWLQPDLTIITTQNQSNPILQGQEEPLLGLDVWEHAYYLDYTYKRPEYISAWWNVVNWSAVEQRYAKSLT